MKTGEMISMMRGFVADYRRYRKEIKKHDAWVRKYARQERYRINPHWMFYTNLKIWIAESEKIFGKRYCPCFEPGEDIETNKRLVCPCKYAEQEIRENGTCHCVLFGKGTLTAPQFKEAEARLMREYRGVPLRMSGSILDTRGMHRDALRNLPIPDSLHQVKRGLGMLKGKQLNVIVETRTEAGNLKSFAQIKGIKYQCQKEENTFHVVLNP